MDSAKLTQTFNGAVEWGVAGSYFKLMSTVNPVTVELFYRGRKVHSAASVEGGHYQRVDFDRVQITTGALEAVSWLYAPAEGGSDRFTGDFNLTDRAARLVGIVYGALGQLAQVLVNAIHYLRVQLQGHGDAETDNNNAFMRGYALGAVAAQYSHIQAKNPAASGKTLYVDSIIIGSTGAPDRFEVCSYDADLTTDGGALYSRDQGAAAASSHVRAQNNAAPLGTPMIYARSDNLSNAIVTFDPPYKLGAGEGLLVRNAAVNLQLEASFLAREY